VANAIWDGTDAVMLSQETSIGAHPVESVRAMAGICLAAERHPAYLRSRDVLQEHGATGTAIARAAAAIADQVHARAIVAFTESGATARRVSKARPAVPVIAASRHPEVLRRTALYAGVVPLEVAHGADTDDMIDRGKTAAVAAGLVRPGDRVVFVAGVPVGESGRTNLVRVEVLR
jgi:pyruvate kinase